MLALIYTGTILGSETAIAKIVSAILMAFVVGLVMSFVFKNERQELNIPTIETKAKIIELKDLILLILILFSLLAPNYLVQKGPYTKKVIIWFVATVILSIYAVIFIEREKIKLWFQESWWFVRLIFPLLLVGVFIVGVIGKLLPEKWIHNWLGGNGIGANFLATIIGAVSYFATMTEAPFVHTLIKMGMGKGPALALLLTGPGLSLPNWIAIARVFGLKKALVYVPVMIILGTLTGFIYGRI